MVFVFSIIQLLKMYEVISVSCTYVYLNVIEQTEKKKPTKQKCFCVHQPEVIRKNIYTCDFRIHTISRNKHRNKNK